MHIFFMKKIGVHSCKKNHSIIFLIHIKCNGDGIECIDKIINSELVSKSELYDVSDCIIKSLYFV